MTAQKLVQAIQANVAAFYADAIDYDTFSDRNRALWATTKDRPRFAKSVQTKLRNAINAA